MITAVVAAVLLVMAFVHAVDLDHDHPELIFGHGPQALVHTQSEKWLFVLFLAAIFFYSNRWRLFRRHLFEFELVLHRMLAVFITPPDAKLRPALAAFYARGILNTKRY